MCIMAGRRCTSEARENQENNKSTGETVWTRAIGGADSDWAEDVCEVADGCYGLSGTTGSFNSPRDAYAVKVDPLGNIIWQFNYGDTSPYREDYGTRASALADTGMVATGWRTDQIHSDPCQSAFLSLDPAAPPNAAQIITSRHPDSADGKKR